MVFQLRSFNTDFRKNIATITFFIIFISGMLAFLAGTFEVITANKGVIGFSVAILAVVIACDPKNGFTKTCMFLVRFIASGLFAASFGLQTFSASMLGVAMVCATYFLSMLAKKYKLTII